MRDLATEMAGKTCLVTGATSGIGKETALGLARLGADVVLVGRDRARGAEALAAVRGVSPTGRGEFLPADLSSLAEVHRLAAEILARSRRLDVLVNNAGASYGTRRTTQDGLEATFAGNHLGPFLLTHLLLPRLAEADGARVVNVASDTHRWVRRIPWDDLQSERRYRAMGAYNLSKLCNVLFTFELARRQRGTGVAVNCLHPGWPLRTALDRDARGAFGLLAPPSKRFGVSASDGAKTSIFLAGAAEAAGVSGRYFVACRPTESSRLSRTESEAARLWAVSGRLSGVGAVPA